MSTKEDFNEFSKILVLFCNYFHDKLHEIKASNIRGFKNTNFYKSSVDDLSKIFGCELESKNFLESIVKLFQRLQNFDFIGFDFHLSPDSENVYKCLSQLLKKTFNFEEVQFQEEQKNILRIVHSTFANEFNEDLSAELNKRFDDKINRTFKKNSILKSYFSEENYLANNDVKFIPVSRLYNKRIKGESHILNLRLHIKKGSTPKSLFFGNFPAPFFKDDEHFIESHNKIIEKAQQAMMDLIIETQEKKIDLIDEELKRIKEELRLNGSYESVDLDKVFRESKLINEKRLFGFLQSAKTKAEKCESRPYSVEQFEHYFSQKSVNKKSNKKNSVSFDESSISATSSSSKNTHFSNRNNLKYSAKNSKYNWYANDRSFEENNHYNKEINSRREWDINRTHSRKKQFSWQGNNRKKFDSSEPSDTEETAKKSGRYSGFHQGRHNNRKKRSNY